MVTDQIKERAKQLGSELLEAMKRPDDPALLQADKADEAATSGTLDEFYTRTGQTNGATRTTPPPASMGTVTAAPTVTVMQRDAARATMSSSALGFVAAGTATGLTLVSVIAAGGLSASDDITLMTLVALTASLVLHVRSYMLQRRVQHSPGNAVSEPPEP